jgi:hypothetical protein
MQDRASAKIVIPNYIPLLQYFHAFAIAAAADEVLLAGTKPINSPAIWTHNHSDIHNARETFPVKINLAAAVDADLHFDFLRCTRAETSEKVWCFALSPEK